VNVRIDRGGHGQRTLHKRTTPLWDGPRFGIPSIRCEAKASWS
jgi:hypothetical protein